jgi:hypothetical protein
VLASVQYLMRNTTLQGFLEAIYIALLETKNIKDML